MSKLSLCDFDYNLPTELIAQSPLKNRDESRLLVYNRELGKITLCNFYNIIEYLKADDIVVLNRTRVMPSRLYGTKVSTGAKIEVFIVKQMSNNDFEVLIRPRKRLSLQDVVRFSDELCATLIDKVHGELTAVMRFNTTSGEDIFTQIHKCGLVPLPPYIREKLDDESRYQTVYASEEGSCAAPTAGLHWTPELIDKARAKGVTFVEIILHVGLGTFLPVKEQDVSKHKMHSEYFEISDKTAKIINEAKLNGRRIIACGTTSVRALESVGFPVTEARRDTDIFIYPPYKFKVVDALITNFHLPKSTLLMLVSAFAGRAQTKKIYERAVSERFRFFSFGDCMFIE